MFLRASFRLAAHWMPRPLAPEFYALLDKNDWRGALEVYTNHPWKAPPVDTYELLKLMMSEAELPAEEMCYRFEDRMRYKVREPKERPGEVEWGKFWEYISKDEVHLAGAALAGAQVNKVFTQGAVIFTCQKLLQAVGMDTLQGMPYSYVSKSNIISAALEVEQFDLVMDMMDHTRLTRSDAKTIWPLVSRYDWATALRFIVKCPRHALEAETVVPQMLQRGCDLETLCLYMEQTGGIHDKAVVNVLVAHAVSVENWPFVVKATAHLEDIDAITPQAHRCFAAMVDLHGVAAVAKELLAKGFKFSDMSVEVLERLSVRPFTEESEGSNHELRQHQLSSR